MWIEDKYHVRFYMEKGKLTQKLEQIKNAMIKRTAIKDGADKKTKPERQICWEKHGISRETKQDTSNRVTNETKKRPKKTS